MDQNEPKSGLTGTQLRAAALVAADEMSDEQISDTVGISRSTLKRWKASDDFDTAVQRAIDRMDRAALRFAVARRDKRLQTINDLYNKAMAVIDARALAYADDDDLHGGETGLVVKDQKGVGTGPAAVVIDTQGVDTALIAEIRALLDDAAKEVGGRSQNVNLTGALTSTIELIGIAPEDI